MWRNLAQSTIATIGNVVAPPESDDDDDDYEEYEEEHQHHEGEGQDYFDDNAARNHMATENLHHHHQGRHQPRQHGPSELEEDYDIHSQGEFPQHNQHQGLLGENSDNMQRQDRGGGGFGGFVGLLAKALDAEQKDYDDSHNQDEEEDEEVHFDSQEEAVEEGGFGISRFLQSSPLSAENNGHAFNLSLIAEEGILEESIAELVVEDDLLNNPPVREEGGGGDDDERLRDGGVVVSEDGGGKGTPPRVDHDQIVTNANSEFEQQQKSTPHVELLQELPEPRRFGLVRESGSVSLRGTSPHSAKSLSGLLPSMDNTVENEEDDAEVELSPTKDDESSPTKDQELLDGGALLASNLPALLWKPNENASQTPEPVIVTPLLVGSEVSEQHQLLTQPVEEVEQPSSDRVSSVNHQSTASSSMASSRDVEVVNSSISPRRHPPVVLLSASLTTKSSTPKATATTSSPQENSFGTSSVPPVHLEEKTEVPHRPPPPPAVNQHEPLPTIQLNDNLRICLASSIPKPQDEHGAATTNLQALQGDEERKRLESRCKEIEQQLFQAQSRIQHLEQQDALAQESEFQLLERFQEKEARLLAAAAEDHEQEMSFLRSEMDVKFNSLQHELDMERETFEREREYFEQLIAEANGRAERAERQFQTERRKQETVVAQYQKHQEREIQMSSDKLVQSMALLDEREAQVTTLKAMVQTLQSRLSEHAEGAQVAEEEVEELHHENEELRQHVKSLEAKCTELRGHVAELHSDSNKLGELRMEVRLLKEERDRVRLKSQNETAAAHGNRAQVEEERDSALAQVLDLQHQLKAALADLEMARTDTERVMMARSNLQVALESFQSEREAELALLEEQRRESERGVAAAHAAALDAMREANNAHIREIQMAADAAVRHSIDEIHDLESKLESFRSENVQMRRSLDEAINRLQATQEDVIDRTLMKNILMDWLTKTGSKERRDVLELMASVLHFTEGEKERVHIGDRSGALEKVVHTVVVPLPPSKADVEHLAGDNVREKWINFLLAETDD